MEAKKYQRYDLRNKSALFFNIGLTIAMLMVIAAFEWKAYDDNPFVSLAGGGVVFDSLIEIPPTVQQPPQAPRVHQPLVVEIPDDEQIPEDLLPDFDVEITPDAIIETIEYTAPPVEESDEPVDFPEYQPEPEGGLAGYYKAIGSDLKYPGQARRMGIEGTVYVQFVVDKDGSVSDVQVMKGIGAGCDEEAMRVIKEGPKWKAGMQNGRKVKVRMRLPIRFHLQ